METFVTQYSDQPDIENEVRRLFRADNEAVDVKWEIIYEQDDDTKQDDSEASMPLPSKTGVTNGPARSHATSTSVGEIGMWWTSDIDSHDKLIKDKKLP